MQIISKLALLLFLTNQSQISTAIDKILYDANCNVQQFYGIPTDIRVSDLSNLHNAKIGTESREGDVYTTALVKPQKNFEVKILFDLEGRYYEAEINSERAVGPKGIRVGSSLADVKKAYPSGKLVYGSEDGRFVTYTTGTNVRMDFDPRDMPPKAFEFGSGTVDVPNLTVRRIRISAPIQ